MSEQLTALVLNALVSYGAAWAAIRVELRWMRADIRRGEETAKDHSVRIRQLEIGD